MNNRIRSIPVLVILVVHLLVNNTFGENTMPSEPTMRIYYIDFDVVPYGPDTSESIEKWQDYSIWFYGQHAFIGTLRGLMEKQPAKKPLAQDRIRLKVKLKGNVEKDLIYLVDYYGVVMREDTKQTFVLTKKQLKELGERITYLHGVVDQRPMVDPWPIK
ncbi:MAG: hypothetical protein HZA17_12140 [Nitrospirae bacterium]|nr:hypothetical protein [Nitrospirota bacterium]